MIYNFIKLIKRKRIKRIKKKGVCIQYVCPRHIGGFIYDAHGFCSAFRRLNTVIVGFLGFKISRHNNTSGVRMWESDKIYLKDQPQGLSSSIRGQMPPEHECTAAGPHSRYQGEARSGDPSKGRRGHRPPVIPLRLPQKLIYFKQKIKKFIF